MVLRVVKKHCNGEHHNTYITQTETTAWIYLYIEVYRRTEENMEVVVAATFSFRIVLYTEIHCSWSQARKYSPSKVINGKELLLIISHTPPKMVIIITFVSMRTMVNVRCWLLESNWVDWGLVNNVKCHLHEVKVRRQGNHAITNSFVVLEIYYFNHKRVIITSGSNILVARAAFENVCGLQYLYRMKTRIFN